MIDTYPELTREPDILANKQWLAEYVAMRENGQPHGFAAMLVTQSPPACRTDNTFFENRGTLDQQLGREVNHYTEIAEQNGYRPGARDVYEPGLARFQGDPEAFVPATGGRAHVKKVLEKRGYRVTNGVGVPSGICATPLESLEPVKSKPLANDIIRENAKRILKEEPDKRKLSKNELRELVVERHGKPSQELTKK